jgi:glycosyltransferase involved in cell wall biosynthesis
MADRLRLAMVVDGSAFGGAEAYARQLLRRAPAWVDPTLLVAAPIAEHFTAPAVKIFPSALNAERAPALAAALAEVAPDVVHVNLVNPVSNRAALRAAQAAAPTVATLHDGGGGAPPAELAGLYSNLAAAVAASAEIARRLSDLGVPAAALHRIRNGVDLPARITPPGDRRPPVVGAVGRLSGEKGLDLLIEAVARLDRRGRRLRVVIAGQGRERERLERMAASLPVVTFLGLCRDVPALLRGFDVFCQPSRREGLPLALLEAMAHGLPCVATAVGDVAEAVGPDALVVPPDDVDALVTAIDRLLHDPGLRWDLGRRARLRALRDFDAERMVAETMRVLAGAV